MEKKRVLVTGANGFIGSNMVDYLAQTYSEEEVEIVATDVGPRGAALNQRAKYVSANLTRKEDLGALFGEPYDYIFHIAAIFSYIASLDALRKVNVFGAANFFWAVKERSSRAVVVVWSSGSVYGITGLLAATEESGTKPKNNYERSKLEEERLALEFRRAYGLKTVVIRPAAVYGPRSKYGAAVPIFMIASGQIPFIIGSGNFVESFVHVRDVIGAAHFLAGKFSKIDEIFRDRPEETRYVFNACDESAYTIEEMFRWVERCLRESGRTDVKLLPVHYPLWALKPLIWWNEFSRKHFGTELRLEPDLIDYLSAPFLMSGTKLRLLGYELKYPDTKIGIRETIEWYRKEGAL